MIIHTGLHTRSCSLGSSSFIFRRKYVASGGQGLRMMDLQRGIVEPSIPEPVMEEELVAASPGFFTRMWNWMVG